MNIHRGNILDSHSKERIEPLVEFISDKLNSQWEYSEDARRAMEMLMTILKKDTEKIDEIFWEKAIEETDN